MQYTTRTVCDESSTNRAHQPRQKPSTDKRATWLLCMTRTCSTSSRTCGGRSTRLAVDARLSTCPTEGTGARALKVRIDTSQRVRRQAHMETQSSGDRHGTTHRNEVHVHACGTTR
eukprot:56258-Eustigmatos_ZCMA.PRE.1